MQVRSNLAQSCINLNIKRAKNKVDLSPVISPKINKKVKSQLKL